MSRENTDESDRGRQENPDDTSGGDPPESEAKGVYQANAPGARDESDNAVGISPFADYKSEDAAESQAQEAANTREGVSWIDRLSDRDFDEYVAIHVGEGCDAEFSYEDFIESRILDDYERQYDLDAYVEGSLLDDYQSHIDAESFNDSDSGDAYEEEPAPFPDDGS